MAWIQNVIDRIMELIYNLELWDAVGFTGQFIFFLRFVVQWIATERKKRTVVPVSFWYLSLLGSAITLVYVIPVRKLVLILAFSLNMLIYTRNLYFVYRRRRRKGMLGAGGGPA